MTLYSDHPPRAFYSWSIPFVVTRYELAMFEDEESRERYIRHKFQQYVKDLRAAVNLQMKEPLEILDYEQTLQRRTETLERLDKEWKEKRGHDNR